MRYGCQSADTGGCFAALRDRGRVVAEAQRPDGNGGAKYLRAVQGLLGGSGPPWTWWRDRSDRVLLARDADDRAGTDLRFDQPVVAESGHHFGCGRDRNAQPLGDLAERRHPIAGRRAPARMRERISATI